MDSTFPEMCEEDCGQEKLPGDWQGLWSPGVRSTGRRRAGAGEQNSSPETDWVHRVLLLCSPLVLLDGRFHIVSFFLQV